MTTKVALDVAGRLNEREPIPYYVDVISENALDNPELRNHVTRVGKVLCQRSAKTPGV